MSLWLFDPPLASSTGSCTSAWCHRIWQRDPARLGRRRRQRRRAVDRTRLGWLDVAETMSAGVRARCAPGAATSAREQLRRGLPARHGRQQPLRRSAAAGLRRRARASRALRPRHDRRTHDRRPRRPGSIRRGRCSSSPARAAAPSKSPRWNASSGRAWSTAEGSAAGRHFIAITDPGHGAPGAWPNRTTTAKCS